MREIKLKLTVELVPSSAWYNNLRKILKPKMWESLRKNVYKKFKYKCAICMSEGRLHAHEVWQYDDQSHLQSLVDIIALCTKCHAVKHIGYAGIQASEGKLNYENLVKHFMKINNCDRQIFEKHINKASKKFEERSRYDWQLNLGSLKNFEKSS